jgi:hypothetical protein
MFSRNKVLLAISKTFNIDKKMVRLIKDIEEITQIDGSSIICQTYKSDTEFPLRLSIYIIDEKIIPKDERVAVSQISRELGCDILMSDELSNPYTMLRISYDGNIEQINVDIEKLDNYEEFYLD